MGLPMSFGLQALLDSDAGYVELYQRAVRSVGNMNPTELKEAYPAEYNSWRNRKSWAKGNGVLWSADMEKFSGFLIVNGPIPHRNWTLDRIDPTGDYVPDNIRWASKTTQSQNRTSARWINVGGTIFSISEIGLRTGRDYDAVRVALDRHGDEHAIYLLNHPLVGPEYAWEFPEVDPGDREELEKQYKDRQDKSWSRMRFFLDLTFNHFEAVSAALKKVNDEKERYHLKVVLEIIRSLHNETVRIYWHYKAAEKTRRIAPHLKAAIFVPRKGQEPVEDDDDGAAYWSDRR